MPIRSRRPAPARHRDAAGNLATSGDITLTTLALPDITAPTVSLSAPAAGATVSGASVTVSATASDTVGVAGVQCKVDGLTTGAEDTSSPYTYVWNTTTATNASHTLTAVARDAAGNTTTAAGVSVTVSNAAPPLPTTYSVSVSPANVALGGTVTLSWTAPANSLAMDWVGLYPAGANPLLQPFLSYVSTVGRNPGSVPYPVPTTPGSYQFIYFRSNTYEEITRSSVFTVQ